MTGQVNDMRVPFFRYSTYKEPRRGINQVWPKFCCIGSTPTHPFVGLRQRLAVRMVGFWRPLFVPSPVIPFTSPRNGYVPKSRDLPKQGPLKGPALKENQTGAAILRLETLKLGQGAGRAFCGSPLMELVLHGHQQLLRR